MEKPLVDKQYLLEWIFSAKAEQTKVERIAKTLDRLTMNQKYNKE